MRLEAGEGDKVVGMQLHVYIQRDMHSYIMQILYCRLSKSD